MTKARDLADLNFASPELTGTPIAPTAAAGTNTTQIATTAFVGTGIANLVDSSPDALNTLNELAAALGDDANFSTTVTNSIATKAPLASPTFTGTATVPTLNSTTAIQMGGTEVLNSSRQLSNIASIDATTATAISAAGIGGGGTVELTANGALTAGQSVILNSSGQAEPIVETVGTLTAENEINPFGYNGQFTKMVFVPSCNGFVQIVIDNNSYIRTVTLKTTAALELSSQNDQIFDTNSWDYLDAAYDPDSDSIGIVSIKSNNTAVFLLGSLSANNANMGSHGTTNLGTLGSYTDAAICYDTGLNKFVATIGRGSDLWVYLISVNPSTRAVTIDASSQVNPNKELRGIDLASDGNGQFAMISGNRTTGERDIRFTTFSISGTTITYGSSTQVFNYDLSSDLDRSAICYDEDAGKFVIVYGLNTGSEWIYARNVAVSSNTPTLGSTQPVRNVSGGSYWINCNIIYDTVGGVTCFYGSRDIGLYAKKITSSGSTITVGSEITLNSDATYGPAQGRELESASSGSSITGGTVYATSHYNVSPPGATTAVYIRGSSQTVTSNSSEFLGFANEAISSGSTGEIAVISGVNENQTGLTPATSYYINGDGTLTTTNTGVYAGRALSSTKLLVKG